jgi:hypothetical protein
MTDFLRGSDVRRALTAVTVLLPAVFVVGRDLGYHAASPFVLFWLLNAAVVLTACVVTRSLFPWTGAADALMRTGLLAFAIVVLSGLVLGSIGRLTQPAYFAFVGGLLLANFLLLPHDTTLRPASLAGLPIFAVAVAAALLAFMIGFAARHAPLTLYDSLSYHLFFPARWLQDQRLSIIPTPFSDVAQAYAPGNGELFFLWLMMPFHGDLLARLGQLPFALLGAIALYALARRLGAPREHAIYPPVFFLLARPVVEQAMGANVDLVWAATFLTSLYFGIVAVDRGLRVDWMMWGVSLGLYWGTKYAALVYTPIVVLAALARGPRAGILWALPGVALFALPWYARNWLVAGSPIYPASLTLAGLTLARGAYDRAAMVNTVFHTDDVRLLPAIAAHAFGPTLFLLWIPVAIVGGVALLRRGWWPHGFLMLVPALMVPLFWLGFPSNIDSRYLLPAVGPALLPFAFCFRGRRLWDRGVHAVYAIGIVWILVGVRANIPAALPWFMNGWLALNGLLSPKFVVWFAVVALVMAAAWRAISAHTRWAMPVMASLVAGTAAFLAHGGERWCQPARCDYVDTTSPYIRPGLVLGWEWLADNLERSTVAYTGINLPYPLSGKHLTNRVIYVNIDGRQSWRFDDYDRRYRAGRFQATPPLLAISSGELMPVSQHGGTRVGALRPRYDRMQGLKEAWIFNLHRQRVGYLFVAALSAYEIDYVWHNADGFPIEDEWASTTPSAFRIVYDNPQVRIYAVNPA